MGEDEEKVFEIVRLMSGPTVDEIISGIGFDPQRVNSLLTIMEIKGIVESYAGRIYISR